MDAAVYADVRSVIQKEHIRLRMDDVLTDPCTVAYIAQPGGSKPYNTACWTWRNDPSPARHYICLGHGITDNATKNLGSMPDYFLAYFRHEICHALYTARDLKSINEQLARAEIPFALFNLFEDARIENLGRDFFEQNFGWLDFEDTKKIDSASSILFACIQHEGRLPAVADRKDYTAQIKKAPLMGKVINYYYPAILECPSAFALLPLMLEWIKDFPEDLPQSGDMEQIGEGGDGLLSALDGAEIISGQPLPTPAQFSPEGAPSGRVETAAKDVTVKDGTTANLISDTIEPVDWKQIAYLSSVLVKPFRTQSRMSNTSDSSKYVNVRGLVSDMDMVFRRKNQLGRARRLKTTMILDLSGSMSSGEDCELDSPVAHGRLLAGVLNDLCRKGVLDCHLILTKGQFDTAYCHTLKMPFDDALLPRLCADGEFEGIDHAMTCARRVLRESRLVFGFTDGNITDAPVDQGHWRRIGVYSIGLYVGEQKRAQKLHKWFNSAIVRPDIAALVRDLVFEIKRYCR